MTPYTIKLLELNFEKTQVTCFRKNFKVSARHGEWGENFDALKNWSMSLINDESCIWVSCSCKYEFRNGSNSGRSGN